MDLSTKIAAIYNKDYLLEKTAEEMLAEQVADTTGLDTTSLTPDQLEQYAQGMLGQVEEVSQLQSQPAQDVQYTNDQLNQMSPEQIEQTPQFQAGDFVGKVAAHSLYNTLIPALDTYINQKLAMSDANVGRYLKAYDGVKGAVGAVGGAAKRVGGAVAGAGKRYGQLMAGGAKGDVGDMAGRRAGNSLTGFKQMRGEALKSLGARAATGVGVLGAGGAGYAATKEASALETIANQKVMQYLQSRGYDTSALNGQSQEQSQVQEPQMDPTAVKMANDMRMAVDQHTDQLALQMLQQMGIPVDQDQEVEQQVDPSYQAQGQVQNFQPGFQG